jgi:hypothetical protein
MREEFAEGSKEWKISLRAYNKDRGFSGRIFSFLPPKTELQQE